MFRHLLLITALIFSSLNSSLGSETTIQQGTYIIPIALDQEAFTWELNPGEQAYLTIDYKDRPHGEVLFTETAEQLWWLMDKPVLFLGSTGVSIPKEVLARKQVFIDLYWDEELLVDEATLIYPKSDGVQVSKDENGRKTLEKALGKSLVLVDAPYISQVANYMVGNVATLDIRGDSLNIQGSGFFNTAVTSGHIQTDTFSMTHGAALDKVLTSDDNGVATWQTPSSGSGFSLPYSGTKSTAGPLFSLHQTGLTTGNAAYFSSTSTDSSNASVKVVATGGSSALDVSTTSTSSYASTIKAQNDGEGSAGYFKATNSSSNASALIVENAGSRFGAEFTNSNLNADSTTVSIENKSNTGGAALLVYHSGDRGTGAHIYSNSTHEADSTLWCTSFGKGYAIKAEVSPGDSTSTTLIATNDASGGAGEFKNRYFKPTVEINNTGGEAALKVWNHHTSDSEPLIDAESKGYGSTAKFSSTSLASAAPSVDITSIGSGATLKSVNQYNSSNYDLSNAAVFETSHTGSYADTLSVTSKGKGDSIAGYSSGSGGSAGYFKTYHTSNVSPTLKVIAGDSSQAAYFVGDVDVTGTLSKSAGSFKIDHPLDPENKTLSHSFVESPDMMNIYNGNVILDSRGQAWIELPEWFEALNRDYRYQLTTIGDFAPVFVKTRLSENRFQVAGGYKGLELSWQITGIRQDAYARKHPIVVEQEKETQDKGLYLTPGAFDLDKSMRIGNTELKEKRQ